MHHTRDQVIKRAGEASKWNQTQAKFIQEPTSVKMVTKLSKILTKTKHQDLDKGRNQNQLRKLSSSLITLTG